MLVVAGWAATTWLPAGEWFTALLTGTNLAADLATAAETAGSPYVRQYTPSAPNGLARPEALPNTNLVDAFTPEM